MSIQTNFLVDRDTGGAGAIAAAFFGVANVRVVDQIRLHANAAMANENLTIEIDSGHNAVYDAVLDTISTNALTDIVWIPARPVTIDATDELDINCANTNNVTWGIEVVYRNDV